MAKAEDNSTDNSGQKPDVDEIIDKARVRLAGRRLSPDILADTEEPAEEAAEWMMTYMDTVTLLVTLFVLLLSVHDDDEKYKKVASSLSMVIEEGILGVSVPEIISLIKPEPVAEPQKIDQGEVLDEIKNRIIAQGLPDLVDVRVIENRINLEINESVLFDVGKAILTEAGHELLDKLSKVLEQGQYRISVEGHTDTTSISTAQFPSNWELSGGRASSVVRYLIGKGIASTRLEATGYADTRPMGDNATSEGRARNRRVNLNLEIGEE